MAEAQSNQHDRWRTLLVGCQGGLNLNQDILTLSKSPNLATQLINYEPAINGGYRRVNGYTVYGTQIGTGTVLGVKVFQSGVVAAFSNHYYYGTGNTWTQFDTGTRTTGATRVRAVTYNWTGTQCIILVDGVNNAAKWNGTTFTKLSGTASDAPADPQFVEEYKNQIFYAGMSASNSTIQWSVPSNENHFDVASGGGSIVVGDQITGLKKFRNSLYIFCKKRIMQLTGSTSSDFALVPVIDNMGCLAPDSIQEINGDLVFLAPDGIRPVSATYRIGDIETSSISRSILPIISDIIESSTIVSCVVKAKAQYRLFYNTSDISATDAQGVIGAITNPSSTGSTTLDIYGTYSDTWAWSQLLGFGPSCCDSGFIGSNEYVVHGDYSGFVYRQEQGLTANGTQLQSIYRTAPLFFDDPALRKIIYKLDVYYTTEGVFNTQTNMVLDFDSSTVVQPASFIITQGSGLITYGGSAAIYGGTAAVYGSTDQPISTNNVIGSGFTIQFNFITNDTTSNPYTIHGFKIQYNVAGRR